MIKEFILIQHSPIIHFQWRQLGASLRATELKSSLIKHLKIDPKCKNQKFEVRVLSKNSFTENVTNSLYFAHKLRNIPSDLKKQFLSNNEITVQINTYFNNTLMKKIETTLPVVLALNNFGTRNNKGFGSYFLRFKNNNTEYERNDFENILKTNINTCLFYFDIDPKIIEPFFAIKLIYSIIKSGFTYKNKTERFDYHSLLAEYFLNNSIIWEKPEIRTFLGINHVARRDCNLEKNFKEDFKNFKNKYVRALLGASEIQTWQVNKKVMVEFPEGIERIPSPLTFKVFKEKDKYHVYFWPNSFFSRVLNKEFIFSSNNRQLMLFTPCEFKICDFLEFVLNKFKNIQNNNNYFDKRSIHIERVV